MVRALRPYPHLLQRQADLTPYVLALVLRCDVHVSCVVVGDVGCFTVFVPAEEIELHLRAEGETDAQCFRVRHSLTQQRAAVGLEGGAIGPQHVAEHPRHPAVNCLISSTVYSIVLLPFSVGYIHLLIGVFAVRCDNGIVVAEHRLRVTVK